MINLRIKFKNRNRKFKIITLPIFSYENGNFKIILPIYEDGKLVDIVNINLPQQVVTNPTVELYRYLRLRGVI